MVSMGILFAYFTYFCFVICNVFRMVSLDCKKLLCLCVLARIGFRFLGSKSMEPMAHFAAFGRLLTIFDSFQSAASFDFKSVRASRKKPTIGNHESFVSVLGRCDSVVVFD